MDVANDQEKANQKTDDQLYQEIMDAAYEREIYKKEGDPAIPYFDFCDQLSDAVVNLGAGINVSAIGFSNADKKFLDQQKKQGVIVAENKQKLTYTGTKNFDQKVKKAFGKTNETWVEALRAYRRPLVAKKSAYKEFKDILAEPTLAGRKAKLDAAKLDATKLKKYTDLEVKFDKDVDKASTTSKITVVNADAIKAVGADSGGTLEDEFGHSAPIKFVNGNLLNLKLGEEEQKRLDKSMKKTDRSTLDDSDKDDPEKNLRAIVARNSPSGSLVVQSIIHWAHAGGAHVKGGSGHKGVNGLFKDNIELFTRQVKQGYWDDEGFDLLEKTKDDKIFKYAYPQEDYEDKNNGLINGSPTRKEAHGNSWAEKIHYLRIDGVLTPSSLKGKELPSKRPSLEPIPTMAPIVGQQVLEAPLPTTLVNPKLAAYKSEEKAEDPVVESRPQAESIQTLEARKLNAVAQNDQANMMQILSRPKSLDVPKVLDSETEAAALDWYKTRNVSSDLIAKIQATVGTTVTGEMDAQCVQFVGAWQKRKTLSSIDGQFGPGSAKAAGNMELYDSLKSLVDEYRRS